MPPCDPSRVYYAPKYENPYDVGVIIGTSTGPFLPLHNLIPALAVRGGDDEVRDDDGDLRAALMKLFSGDDVVTFHIRLSGYGELATILESPATELDLWRLHDPTKRQELEGYLQMVFDYGYKVVHKGVPGYIMGGPILGDTDMFGLVWGWPSIEVRPI